MLNRFVKTVFGVVLVASLCVAQQKTAKDQAEADLYNSAQKETDPVKKLTLLDQWTEKYPDTAFKQERNLFYVQAYSLELQQAQAQATNATAQDNGLKAANTVIEKADTLFAPDARLSSVTEDQWQTAKKQTVDTAHKTLASISLQKKQFDQAEAEYKKILTDNPNDAGTSYLLGTSIVSQRKVERIPEALFYFARAESITGTGELNAQGKKETDAYLQKQYKNYHGDLNGLDDLKAMAAKSATPPEGFKIESVTDISKKGIAAEEEFDKAHPEIVQWRGIRDQLTAPGGDAYFGNMKGSQVPGLKGKVVAQNGPKELTVSIDNATPETAAKAEAMLKFDSPLKGTVPAGTDLTFSGVPTAYTKEPFMINFDVDKKDVQGLGAAAGPATTAPAHRAAPKGKAKKK